MTQVVLRDCGFKSRDSLKEQIHIFANVPHSAVHSAKGNKSQQQRLQGADQCRFGARNLGSDSGLRQSNPEPLFFFSIMLGGIVTPALMVRAEVHCFCAHGFDS